MSFVYQWIQNRHRLKGKWSRAEAREAWGRICSAEWKCFTCNLHKIASTPIAEPYMRVGATYVEIGATRNTRNSKSGSGTIAVKRRAAVVFFFLFFYIFLILQHSMCVSCQWNTCRFASMHVCVSVLVTKCACSRHSFDLFSLRFRSCNIF